MMMYLQSWLHTITINAKCIIITFEIESIRDFCWPTTSMLSYFCGITSKNIKIPIRIKLKFWITEIFLEKSYSSLSTINKVWYQLVDMINGSKNIRNIFEAN